MGIKELIKNAPTVDLFSDFTVDERIDIDTKGKIAAAILNRRYDLNMNLEEFAKYIGVPREEVEKYENGDYVLTVSVLQKIHTKVLGVEVV